MLHFASLLLPPGAVAPNDPNPPMKPVHKLADRPWRSIILLLAILIVLPVMAAIWQSYDLP